MEDYLCDSLNVIYRTPLSYSSSSAFIFNENVKETIPTNKIVKEWFNNVVRNHNKKNFFMDSVSNKETKRGLSSAAVLSLSSPKQNFESKMESTTTSGSSLSSMAAAHLSKFNASSSNAFIIPKLSRKMDPSINLPSLIVPKPVSEGKTPASGPSLMALANAHFNKIYDSSLNSSHSSAFSSSPNDNSSLMKNFKQMAIGNCGSPQEFYIPPLTNAGRGAPFSVSSPKVVRNVDSEMESDVDNDIDLTVALMRTRPVVEKKPITVAEAFLSMRPTTPDYPSLKLIPLSNFSKVICRKKFRRLHKKITWTVIKTKYRPFNFKELCPDELFAAAADNKVLTSINLSESVHRIGK